jgi:hypothetical protein
MKLLIRRTFIIWLVLPIQTNLENDSREGGEDAYRIPGICSS